MHNRNRWIITAVVALMSLAAAQASAQAPVLRFNSGKKFKIVQFTDTHFIAGDKRSDVVLKTMNTVLDKEQPDLVIYTGDVVTGKPAQKGWEQVTEPVIARKLPFAVVYGNHDDEQDVSREEISGWLVKMPGCLLVPKVENVYGWGNYVLEVKSSDGAGVAALIWCLDSNTYSTIKGVEGYGWFHADQIEWYRTQSRKYTATAGKPLPALAYFHIPLPEYAEAYKNEKNPAIGVRLEGECPPAINTGMFASMLECGDVMGVFVGHDHVNDYIAYLHGIALAYGRWSGGKTTYGELPNGARVVELTEGEKGFNTWIRIGSGEELLPVRFPVDFQPKK